MFWSLMIHAITRLFKTFAFIYMLCNNYATLNTTTKSVNKSSPLICQSSKKRYEKIVTFVPSTWREQQCFRDRKVTLYDRNIILSPKKLLVLLWCYLSLCKVTGKNQKVLINGAKDWKGTVWLRLWSQNYDGRRVFLSNKSNQIICYDQAGSLQ